MTWQCDATVLYLSPNMAARVRDVTERERPDVVFLRPPDMQILQDYVVYSVRERWPALYRTSVRLSAWLIDLAGGGPQGAPWFRGWLFRAPRWLMSKVVGVAPAMRVPDAVACVRETLDALSRLEDVTVVYSLPMSTVPPNISIDEARRRRNEFASGVKAYRADNASPASTPTRRAPAPARRPASRPTAGTPTSRTSASTPASSRTRCCGPWRGRPASKWGRM